MPQEPGPPSGLEPFDEAAALLAGLGINTMVLFPLALPAVALAALIVIPAVASVVAAGLLVAVLVMPVLMVRRLRRAGAPHALAPDQAGPTPDAGNESRRM